MEHRPATTFKYRTLDPIEIRLFRLLPGCLGDVIRGRIEHRILDDNPVYTALSYPWGHARYHDKIKLGHDEEESELRDFPVTVNLEAALQHMRKEDEDLVLWIDALCIDQTNLDERNHEVRRMGEIYSKCSQLNIWLGRLNERTDLWPRVAPIWETEASNQRAIAAAFRWMKSTDLQSVSVEPPDYLAYSGLCCIFLRPWFRRLWVLQEVTLANWPQICFLGTHKMPFSRLIQYFGYVKGSHQQFVWLTKTYPQLTITAAFLEAVWCCSDPSYKAASQVEQFTMMLLHASKLEVENDMDRVYGILGLVKDARTTEALYPDYQKNFTSFYSDLVKYLIKNRASLWFLDLCPGRYHSLPSWVPTWNHTSLGDPGNHIGTSSAVAQFAPWDERILLVPSVAYGSVVQLFEITKQAFDSVASFQCWLGNIDRELEQVFAMNKLNALDTARACLRMELESLFNLQNEVPELSTHTFLELLDKPQWRDTSDFPTENDMESIKHTLEHMQNVTLPTCRKKLVFISSGKSATTYLAEVGDRIALVNGCFTALLLRAEGGSFRIVENAWIEGFCGEEYTKNRDEFFAGVEEWETLQLV